MQSIKTKPKPDSCLIPFHKLAFAWNDFIETFFSSSRAQRETHTGEAWEPFLGILWGPLISGIPSNAQIAQLFLLVSLLLTSFNDI